VTDAALRAAASLSDRYVNDRFLPDKAIDLVDEAASRLRMEIDSMPVELDEANRALARMKVEAKVLADEDTPEARERLAELDRLIADRDEEVTALRSRWEAEKAVLSDLKPLQEEIDGLRGERDRSLTDAQRTSDNAAYQKAYEAEVALKKAEERLAGLESKIAELDDGERLLREAVTDEDVAKVVATWTGIPVTRMLETEREKLIHMEDRLHERMIGQEEAVTAVANAVRRSRSGLTDGDRPLGSFLFLGPTGVGKTELCKALAEFLFDDERAMVRVDMSEFMEKHSVARMIGAPPGYVGYEEGGKLTEAVRRNPYSVILLDEIEKAHPDVFNVLLQVLDDGRLTDGQGRTVDFRNAIVVMTSNIGSRHILELADEAPYPEIKERVLEELRTQFRPEFLNRIDETIVFEPLTAAEIRRIVDLQLARLEGRLAEEGFGLSVSDDAKDLIAKEGYDPVYGARPLKRVIQQRLENSLANEILAGRFEPGATISVAATPDGFLFQ
ncbi:MAG: AAA family ATPase, partial [Planctomycetota bacterium]